MHKSQIVWYCRMALFIIYTWFGALKIIGYSPASPLVEALLAKTLPFISFPTFIFALGIFEVVIGILFLIPKLHKLALLFFILHMITTTMPLILLPSVTWAGFMIPTLEGQYIIKNLALIAIVLVLDGEHRRAVQEKLA